MSENARVTIVASLIGSIIGWAIGVAQLIVIGSWDLFYWNWMPLIPLYSGLGWALFGMIMAGSGLFLKKPSIGEREAEEAYPEAPAA